MSQLIILQNTDLFSLNTQAYAQGCNTKGVMGSGIAAAFKKYSPQMYDHYHQFCLAQDDRDLIGTIHSYKLPSGRWLFNLFTQIEYGRTPGYEYAHYDWVLASCIHMLRFATDSNISTIGMPAIGCGLGGLRWPVVKLLIEAAIQAAEYQGAVMVALPTP